MLSRALDGHSALVRVTINGRSCEVREGDNVAAALLAAGVVASRRAAVSESPRGAYCLMGVCFECLVTIDGVENRQGCLVAVREGMAIKTEWVATEVDR